MLDIVGKTTGMQKHNPVTKSLQSITGEESRHEANTRHFHGNEHSSVVQITHLHRRTLDIKKRSRQGSVHQGGLAEAASLRLARDERRPSPGRWAAAQRERARARHGRRNQQRCEEMGTVQEEGFQPCREGQRGHSPSDEPRAPTMSTQDCCPPGGTQPAPGMGVGWGVGDDNEWYGEEKQESQGPWKGPRSNYFTCTAFCEAAQGTTCADSGLRLVMSHLPLGC